MNNSIKTDNNNSIREEKIFILYVKTGCPYCAAVIHKMEDLGFSWEEKNVADPGVYAELEKIGGKRQEPYLIDKKTGIEMYESDMILDYLERFYGKEKINHNK